MEYQPVCACFVEERLFITAMKKVVIHEEKKKGKTYGIPGGTLG